MPEGCNCRRLCGLLKRKNGKSLPFFPAKMPSGMGSAPSGADTDTALVGLGGSFASTFAFLVGWVDVATVSDLSADLFLDSLGERACLPQGYSKGSMAHSN